LIAQIAGGANALPHFDYILSPDFRALQVKSNNDTDELHARLLAAGKISSTMNQAYLENLCQAVRYWDGKEWKKKVVSVMDQSLIAN
jgi:hypothetical protein